MSRRARDYRRENTIRDSLGVIATLDDGSVINRLNVSEVCDHCDALEEGLVTPRLLDLGCGAGGAAMGYHRLGFDVLGVDIKPQPNYPFDFLQGDAIAFLTGYLVLHAAGTACHFDAIHASMPCQRWAAITVKGRENHPDLITPLRPLLQATGLPWVMENVPAAPLWQPVMVCGGALDCFSGDLQLHRHRMFEANFPLVGTECRTIRSQTVSVVGHGSPSGNRGTLGRNPTIAEKREAMGITWTNRDELSEAIPPVYTEYVGAQLLAEVERRAGNKVGGETVSREAREYVPPTIIRTQGDLAARRMWEATEQAKRERAAALPAVDTGGDDV